MAAFFAVALAFIFILLSIFLPYIGRIPDTLHTTLLQQLAQAETARGLITFLVAVSTVAIALILIVYIAMSTDSVASLKERFAFGKEVLASLVGILGTIIGFYFGTTQDTGHHGSQERLTLESLSITPAKPVKGENATVKATLLGGRAPYGFTIQFSQKGLKPIHGEFDTGTISQAIKLDAYDPAKPLDIRFEATDPSGASSGDRIHLDEAPPPAR